MSAALALAPHEVADKCTHSPKESGVEATFFPIDETWGFKYWYDETLRDMNFIYQQKAADHGLAPHAKNPTNFIHPDSDMMVYGFFTEICPTLLSRHPHWEHLHWYHPCKDKQWKWDDETANIDFNYYHLPNLEKQLREIGFVDVSDLHSNNVGFMADGRFVCIDFGQMLLEGE